MVYLGSRKTKDKLLELLRLVFKEEISATRKKKRLDKEYEMDLTSDMEEELNTMCNLSEGIADRAEARGVRKGKREEKMENAINLLKLGISPKIIAEGLKLSIVKVLELERKLSN